MNTLNHTIPNETLIDLSETRELNFWADKLGVSPEVIKTAVRASMSNSVEKIINYLTSCNKLNKAI